MTKQDHKEFEAYCRQLSARQVLSVIEKEDELSMGGRNKFHRECADIARIEAAHRDLI